ncbi:MAG TPA: GAF domain-containing protein, partial [Polyangiaceae bacterium]|nr:GAF domain-containing protein [Polyangiaceae bacterium]
MTPADSEGAPRAARRVSAASAPDALESRMSVVDEVSQALALDAGLRQRLESTLDVLGRRLHVARAVVYALDASARQLEIVACHGLGAQHYRPRLGAGVVGRAAQSRQRIIVPEVRLEPMALSELAHPEDWNDDAWSQAAVPLLSGKSLTGVLACYARDGSPIAASPDFSAVAALIAECLARARNDGAPGPEAPDSTPRPRSKDSVFDYANLVGASPAMRLIYEEIAQVARTNATTLIRGE